MKGRLKTVYIQKLTLHNFKGFDDIEMEFDHKLSVIVGANGSGKTSVIEGLAIAVSTMFVKMDGQSGKGIDKSQAHLKSYTAGSIKEVQAQYPIIVNAMANIRDTVLSWSRSLNKPNGNTTIIDAKQMIDFGIRIQNDLRKGKDNLTLPIIAYYGTGRLWDYHREKQSDVFKSNNRMNGYVDCVDGTANIKLMMNWFSKMTVQKYQNQELGLGGIPELDAVYSAMETCYKRITGDNEVKVQYNLGTKDLEVAYRDKNGEYMRIPINQLSDGYKSTISLVADIAYRMSVLNPQFLGDVCQETDGIIMIDEIDLHLHPAWQQRIIGDLQAIFPKVQFIVTTHAPAVINSVKKENLIILDDGDISYPSGEIYGKDMNTIVRGVMGANERPLEVKKAFDSFYTFLEDGDYQEAEKALNDLEQTIGNDDADLAACRVKLKLRLMRG